MISRPGFLAAVLVAATLASPALATTVVPDASKSSVEPVLVGDSNGMQIGDGFRVSVRDFSGSSMVNSVVTLQFSGTSARPYTSQVSPAQVSCPSIRNITGVTGDVVFRARFGGFANTPAIVVRADGVLLATVLARSTDLDADGATGIQDLSLFRFNFLHAPDAKETDYDESGSTDIGDFSIFRQVFLNDLPGTTCP